MSNLPEGVKEFWEYIQLEKNYSVHTIREYESDLAEFIAFLTREGISSPKDIEYRDARLYVTELYNKKLKRTTISRKISAIRSFYKFGNRQYGWKEDAFRSLFHPKKEERLPHFFYEEELAKLFETVEGDDFLSIRNRAILELLYATGMRVSELTGLTLRDVDVRIQVVKVMGKGRKERYIPYGQFAHDALERYLEHSRPKLMKNASHQQVFVNQKGDPLTDRGVRYILNELMKKCSLQTKIYPHMLRHTFATHLLNNGADMRTVQELLGHSHLSSTQVYTHVTKDHLRATYLQSHPRA
ncbi:tyrosine recombinase XerC [Paenisporosarcina cavernae]|uniref:Tyrosine recombinase XerC n=1 Tax=Paenisporosarcina cavernae TaxID=2320858 RepID=A0A385YUJ4_9BACL|nr:tyrosine recombinase XerC [Paenisporosarcina cavernae]AYC29232.1 tyrosine recombinase XerC [Paenisporosarcina cavernae]